MLISTCRYIINAYSGTTTQGSGGFIIRSCRSLRHNRKFITTTISNMILSAIISAAAVAAAAPAPVTPQQLIDRIATGPYRADAEFSVTMPQLPDDVVYTLALSQTPAPADTLCPAAYLIDWTITKRPGSDTPGAADKGFSAYFGGNHYSLIAERLRERHFDSDPDAFMRPRRGGVAVTTQFADFIPILMAQKLREMAADPRYTVTAVPDTVIGGEKAVAILTAFNSGGATTSEAEYIFYPGETLTPRRVLLENNTGSIGEQTITATFAPAQDAGSAPAPVTEEALMALYPDEFERFRTSSYRLENLPGRHLPAIASPTLDGSRYTRTASQSLDAPTVIVLLDAGSGFTGEVIDAVRTAARQIPWRVDVVWAFTDNDPDRVAEVISAADGRNETILRSSAAVARDCGATAMLPAMVFAGRDGIVSDFIAGFNNSLSSDVVKKIMAMKP